jgi:hypothetical protein
VLFRSGAKAKMGKQSLFTVEKVEDEILPVAPMPKLQHIANSKGGVTTLKIQTRKRNIKLD